VDYQAAISVIEENISEQNLLNAFDEKSSL
jgi:hypothetical protein